MTRAGGRPRWRTPRASGISVEGREATPEPDLSADPPSPARRFAALLAVAGAVLLGFGAWHALPSDPVALVRASVAWIEAAGPLGHLVFVLAYGAQTVLLVPASWSHTAAGFVYGPWLGPLVASVCATAFSSVNFWLGRTLLRPWVARRVARSPMFAVLDRRIADQGAWIVLLIRLPPISPFNPMSYLLGATRVRFRDFVLGTWAGSLLPVVLFSQLGAGLSDLGALFAGEATGPAWFQWVGLAITLLVSVIVARFARQALADAAAAPSAA